MMRSGKWMQHVCWIFKGNPTTHPRRNDYVRQSSHILQLNFSIFDTPCRHIWLKLKFGFGNCACPLLLLIAVGNIGRVHRLLAGSLWPVKMTYFTFLEVLVDGWIDVWMVVIRWQVGSWHLLMEKWVDGWLRDEWMERELDGWFGCLWRFNRHAASFPWSHHYYPIFASYITILFAINNSEGNNTLVNSSADINP